MSEDDDAERPSEFVLKFRALPEREKKVMFDLLFTDKDMNLVALENFLSVNRLLQIKEECEKRLGLRGTGAS